ncbi:hypothetical protein [Streptomyces turgidiscabies]|uniref:hypothetical protein n=1 Tax=Streptomyces turgidiscabies TaxID=85558 RepID=UPI0027D8E728|nr:hypothetical protein [Streptomyces turgidiscabies]
MTPRSVAGAFAPVTLRTFVGPALPLKARRALREKLAPDERARLAAESARPAGGRLLEAREGLRLLLGQALDADPPAVVGPCPHCGRPHNHTACSPAGRRLHFATIRRGDLIVYAVSRFPVGLGLAVPDGPGRQA